VAALFVLSHVDFEIIFLRRFTVLFTLVSCVYAHCIAPRFIASFWWRFFGLGDVFSLVVPNSGSFATFAAICRASLLPVPLC
jgi:hypothetical protein